MGGSVVLQGGDGDDRGRGGGDADRPGGHGTGQQEWQADPEDDRHGDHL